MQKTIRGTLPLGFPVLVTALILLTAAPNKSAAAGAESAETITAPLRDAVYNNSPDENEIIRLLDSSLVLLDDAALSSAEKERGEALAYYYLGRYYQSVKTRRQMASYADDLRKGRYLALRKYYSEREEALGAYNLAREAAESYLELNPGAPAYSLLGEILGQMMFLGNAAQALTLGPKARKNVKKALTLNPEYTKALIQEASRLAYSPPAYGGNPDEARILYRRILRKGTENREDEFNIYGGFAMAAFMEQNDEQALSWFEEALKLYPGNIFVLGMMDFLREDSNGEEHL